MKSTMRWLVGVVVTMTTMMFPLTTADLECAIGWGKGTHRVSEEQINDGYCDCPLDGADEPRTNACSGSTVGAFAGIKAISMESPKYQCPQQKKLQIPYSRINDGICDCCDGSDELPSVCPDICDQVLAEERAIREKMAREFSIGKELRQKETAEFQNVLKDKEKEKKEVDEELEEVKEQLIQIESELDQTKHEYMQERVIRAGEVAKRVAGGEPRENTLTGLLEPLSNDEIMNVIIHSCQMAGEMQRAADLDDATCVPLRLAGLDAALLWTRENDGSALMKRLHRNVREEGKLLADILVQNARAENDSDRRFLEIDTGKSNKRRKKNTRKKPNRRRLQAISDDDDELGMPDDDHYPDDYIDDEIDDYMNDEYNGEEGNDRPDDQKTEEGNEKANPEQEMLEKLKESLFSQPRVALLQRSQEIFKGIDDLLKEDESEDKEEEKDTEDSSTSTEQTIDPAAYNMVKSTLEDREKAIERGFDYAVSAKILLNSLTESTEDQDQLREDLLTLAVGTSVFGKLSVTHIWQIFQAVLTEFSQNGDDSGHQEKTCSTSPWVASCPPRTITRGSISFPPKQVLQAAQILCTTPTFTKEKAEACAADADNELPTVMPDGYYGYDTVQPRDENDILDKIATEWEFPIAEAVEATLSDLEGKRDKLADEQRDVEKSMEEISDLLDGAKEGRFGRDGELFALKDKCYSVKAGKYTYEGCVFGSASQKEGDAKSGTSLGQWEGVNYEKATGERIFKWANGVKCWNGPQRSATAYVTCGAETKVLSADEPDTCRYVLKMESHIACDDAFQTLHEL